MGRRAKMAEIVLGRVLEADQIVGQLFQSENLPPREPVQVGKHRHGLLPGMTGPRQRIEGETGMIEPQTVQQLSGRSAGSLTVGRQFRAVADDAGGVGLVEILPRPLAVEPAPVHGHRASARSSSPYSRSASVQQFRVVHVEPQPRAAGHRLKQEILDEPALIGAAPADAPGHRLAGKSGQTQGTLPRANLAGIEYYEGQLADFDEAVLDGTVGHVAQGGGTARMADAACWPPKRRRHRSSGVGCKVAIISFPYVSGEGVVKTGRIAARS